MNKSLVTVLTLSLVAGCAASGDDTSSGASSALATTSRSVGSDAARALDGCEARAPRAFEESSAVPSSALITDYAVIRDSLTPNVVVISTFFRAPVDSSSGPAELSISESDVIVAGVGVHEVRCRQGQDCVLPFVEGAPYRVSLSRANGDSSAASIGLPRETRITSPREGALFTKDEPVVVSWTPSASTGNYGLALSSFLGGLDCDTQGFIDWFADTSAKIPAGYLGQCPGSFRERFVVFYTNLTSMPSVAGGVLKGYATATLHFTYLDDVVRARPEPTETLRCNARTLAALADSTETVASERALPKSSRVVGPRL